MSDFQRKLVEEYNQQRNLLVFTNYPPRGRGVHTAKIGGVAGFAKNKLLPLAKKLQKEGRSIIVLADVLDRPSIYEEDGILIVRTWRRNSFTIYPVLASWILKFPSVKDVIVEFEFASFGDFWVTSFFPALLLFLKATGKQTNLVLHQVVTDLWGLAGHLGLLFDTRRYRLFSALLKIYYFLLGLFSDRVIVLEEIFSQRLRGLVAKEKVMVIPHGVEGMRQSISKVESRKALKIDSQEFVILSFGFVTWYKGNDLLLKAFLRPTQVSGKPVRLIIAGGVSPTQNYKPHYQRYYQQVQSLASGLKNATISGFIPEAKIGQYFAAADLVVFPYRTVMSSSGPLSLALAYGKPVLFSHQMREYFSSADMQMAAREVKLSPEVLLLPTDIESWPGYLNRLDKAGKMAKIRRFVEMVAVKRSFNSLSGAYYSVLTQPVGRFVFKPQPALA